MKNNDICPILAFRDNYIWTWLDKPANKAWVVDPGEAAPVIRTLGELGVDLGGVLITHHHYDHSGGIKELLNRWPNIPIFGSYKSVIKEINSPVHEGMEIECGPLHLKILEIPGHTLDHIAYWNDAILFSGDTLFSAGCGKVFEGTPEMMYQSLTKLINLSDSIKIYCGHEYTQANLKFAQQVEPQNPNIVSKLKIVTELREANKPTLPSLLSEEKIVNPFLRCHEENVIKSVQQHAHSSISNPIDVFTELRSWKNTF